MYKLELHLHTVHRPGDATIIPLRPDPRKRAVLSLDPTATDMEAMVKATALHIVGAWVMEPTMCLNFSVYNFEGVKSYDVEAEEGEEQAEEEASTVPDDEEVKRSKKRKSTKTEHRPVYGSLPTSFTNHFEKFVESAEFKKQMKVAGFILASIVTTSRLSISIMPPMKVEK